MGQSPASKDLHSKVLDALELARPALLAHVRNAATGSTRSGELALVVLAALHDGIDPRHADMAKAIKKLAKAKPNQTYDIALRLIVLDACPSFPDRSKLAKKDLKRLLQHLSRRGCFQYFAKPSTWDLSNTQYGALGLRAALSMGLRVPRDVWRRMAQSVRAQQGPTGSFGYARSDSAARGYASMTAAGIAVLAVCQQGMEGQGQLARDLDGHLQSGWRWFGRNTDRIGSPKERWSFYFHYGLERAAILCGVDKVAGVVDWYEAGARMFVDEQLAGGGWQSAKDGFPGSHLSGKRGDSVPTAFAVLFLRRKFQRNIGPITQHIVRLVNIGPMSKPADISACSKTLVARGIDALPDTLQALRSEVETKRRAAAGALQGLCGQDFGYDPARDRDGNRRALRQVEMWYLKNR
ncbi:MAG: hypothetical protein AB8H80_08885 [Planctomycetota bacterium]